MSYLPYAHIAERLFSLYSALWKHTHVYFCPEPNQMLGYVQHVRPIVAGGVPRVWEKLWAGLGAKLQAEPPRRRRLAHAAIAAGRQVVRCQQRGQAVPLALRAHHHLGLLPPAGGDRLKEHPLVGQALAFGDRRPYIVALIVLDHEVVPGWARQRGIADATPAALAEHPLVVEEVQHAVAAANQRLARVEQVKRFKILPAEWTGESEELTPTLKLKRRVIHSKYAPEIDVLYAGTT